MNALDRFMLPNPININLESQSVQQVGVAFAVGSTLGLIALILGYSNPLLILAAMGGLVVVVMGFTSPEIVILTIVLLVSGIVPDQYNVYIGLGVGRFQVTDLLLIMLLLVIIVRVFIDKTIHFVTTPLDIPLLLFSGAIVIGMATAVLNHGIQFKDTTYEARILMGYLIFFAVTNLIRTKPQLVRLVQGIFLIGILVASMMLLQSILGRSFSLMDPTTLRGEELIRFYNPGYFVVFITVIALICGMALDTDRQYRVIRPAVILVLSLGLVLGLGRNGFVSGAISIGVLMIMLRKPELSRFVVNLLVFGGVAIVVVALLTITESEAGLTRYLGVLLERMSHLFSEKILSPEENLMPRLIEIQYAWVQITQSPIWGIGLNTFYRPAFYAQDPLRNFIHNAYMGLWLKTGLLGLISFLWFSILGVVRGLLHWRDTQGGFLRAVILGFTLAYLGMMFSNLVAPSFVHYSILSIYGVILGINEVVFAHSKSRAEF